MMPTETFWIFLTTSVIGCFLTLSRMLYKSKCVYVKFCGLEIKRDVEVERDIDEEIIHAGNVSDRTV